MTPHTITVAQAATGHSYCTTCGRNVWPSPQATTPAVGVWGHGGAATTAVHSSTGKAVVAARMAAAAAPVDAHRPWQTTAQAAEQLGVTPATVRQIVARGALPARREGRDLYIDRADVEAYAASRKPRPTRPTKPETSTMTSELHLSITITHDLPLQADAQGLSAEIARLLVAELWPSAKPADRRVQRVSDRRVRIGADDRSVQVDLRSAAIHTAR